MTRFTVSIALTLSLLLFVATGSVAAQEVSPTPAPDTEAPLIYGLSPAQYASVSGQISIKATINDASLSHYYLSIRSADGTVVGGTGTIQTTTAITDIVYPFDTSKVKDGNYRIVISSADIFGNTATRNIYISIINTPGVTDVAPDVYFNMSGDQNLVSGVVTFKGSTLDTNLSHYYMVIKDHAGSIVGGLGVIYDRKPFSTKDLLTWDSRTVPDGSYTISYAARDLAGNQDDESRVNLRILVDNNNPTASLTSLNQHQSVSGIVPVFASMHDEDLSHYYFAVRNVDAIKVAGTSTVAISAPVTDQNILTWDTTLLQDGTYQIKLSVADKKGNIGMDTKLVTISNHQEQILIPPSITLKRLPKYIHNTVQIEAGILDTDLSSYLLTVTDSAGTVVKSIEANAASPFMKKPVLNWVTTEHPDGEYTISYSATDIQGNTSTDQFTTVVDNTKPEASLYVPLLTIGTISIHGNIADQNLSHYYMVIRDSEGNLVSGPGQVSLLQNFVGELLSWDYSGLERGYYTVELHVADKADNVTTSTLDVYVFGL